MQELDVSTVGSSSRMFVVSGEENMDMACSGAACLCVVECNKKRMKGGDWSVRVGDSIASKTAACE